MYSFAKTLHPNTMDFAYTGGVKSASIGICSVLGGAFKVDGRAEQKSAENVFPVAGVLSNSRKSLLT